jgi:transposase
MAAYNSTDVAANVARLGTAGLIHRAAAGIVRAVEKASPAGGELVRKEAFRTEEDEKEPHERNRNELEARRNDLKRVVEIARRSVKGARAWIESGDGKTLSPEGRGRILGAVELTERILEENVQVEKNEKGEDEARELERRSGAGVVSVVDTDARHGAKSNTKKFTGYKAHVAVTDRDVITRVEVTPGNSDDGRQLTQIRDGMERDHGLRPEKMRADSAYSSGENICEMERKGTTLVAPLAKSGRPSGGFPKDQFKFDAERGVIVCPAGKESIWSLHREHLHGTVHEFSLRDCGPCPLKAQCTKARVRSIFISDYEPAFERMRTYLKTDDGKRDRTLRSERERVFEEMKDCHGMRRARYWGLAKMRIQVYMIAIVVDVKRLVGWLDRRNGVIARAT